MLVQFRYIFMSYLRLRLYL